MGSSSSAQKSIQFRMHTRERRIILLAGDIFAAVLAWLVAVFLWGQIDYLKFPDLLDQRVPTWFYLLPLFWIIVNVELYDVRRAGRRSDTVKGVASAAAISLILYLFVFFLSEPDTMPRRGMAYFIVAASILMLIWRFIYIRVLTTPELMRRVLIVGAGRAGSALVRVIKEIWPPPFNLIGLIDDDPLKRSTCVEGYPILGGSRELLEIVDSHGATDLIFSITGEMCDEMFRAMLQAEESGIEVTTMPIVYEDLLGRVPISLLRSDWILRSFVDEARARAMYEAGKRLVDIVGGLVGVFGLVLMTPLIGTLILMESGRPVFYKQGRLGKNGREYQIFKFRSMRDVYDEDGNLLPDKDRMTRVGWFLRKTHMDEIPQFLSVLRGEMSLVGPRAEISQLVAKLQSQVPFYRARLLVKPGITGWAQVNYGYAATVEETLVKLEYDLYYIKHRTLLLDFVILLRTFGTVVGFRGQ